MKAFTAIPALVFAGSLMSAALAQSPSAPNDAWRYKLQRVDGGFLRLDSQTGQVSFCREKDTNWTCETVADDRAALEDEINRLQERVAMLERQAKENSVDNKLRMPSDAEVDQVMTFLERVMRRFRGVVENLKREWESGDRKAL